MRGCVLFYCLPDLLFGTFLSGELIHALAKVIPRDVHFGHLLGCGLDISVSSYFCEQCIPGGYIREYQAYLGPLLFWEPYGFEMEY